MRNAFVRKISEYASLSDADIRALIEISTPTRKVAKSRDLIREGDKPEAVFIILEGWAIRYKMLPDGSRQITSFMMPGDLCSLHVGELEEMDHSIGTITECKVAAVPREKMEGLVVSSPNLTKAFWRLQLIDEGTLRAWIVSIGRRNSTQRVAHLMLEIHVRMRNIGLAHEHTCEMPFTQVVLADALGLTPVHTNRVLAILRKRRMMQLSAGRLKILDVGELAKVAGFDENYLHRRTSLAA